MNIRKHKAWGALALALAAAPVSAAGVNFFRPDTGAPALLSATGVYSDIVAKKVDTAMNYFEVNAALWSDGAAKKRWIILPPGTRITYVDSTDYFDYPNKTIFVKNFYLDTVLNDSTTRRYWETRLLVNKEDLNGKDYWYGFSYRWKADASDAMYVGSAGMDSVFNYYPRGVSQGLSYKKWTFPSAEACVQCHRVGTSMDVTARGVLGFFPAQLKRPSSIVPGTHQIDALFDSGVFVGTRPTAAQKLARWKGIGEPLPSGPEDLRFRTLDTMARAYIGANCSGCHSTRNIPFSNAPSALNYDYYQMKPVVEFGAQEAGSAGVDILDEDTTQALHDGRYKYVLSVRRAGLPMTPGTPWDLALPPGAMPPTTLISPGYPSLSMMLYRQFAMRRAPWRDSLKTLENLKEDDPDNWKSWLFATPWGSQAWRNALAAHTTNGRPMKVNDVVLFSPDGLQMPPVATHIPDTAAMRVLGEWAKTYRTLYPIPGQPIFTRVKGNAVRMAAGGARIQNRLLIVPEGWSGKAQMFSISGRVYTLPSAGKGRYSIPQTAPSGLYFFRVGNRTFRASVLR